MWAYFRIFPYIPYIAHITNEEVLRQMNKKRDLLHTVKYRKTSCLGNVLRNDKYNILQLLIKGKIEGKKPIGRKRLYWVRNQSNWISTKFCRTNKICRK